MSTVSTDPRRTVIDLATDSAGPFDVSFTVYAPDSMRVFIDGVRTLAFTETVDVSAGPDTSPQITLDTAATSGSQIIIVGDMDVSRDDDYTLSGPGLVPHLNDDLGKLTANIAEAREAVARTVRVLDEQELAPIAETPAERAGRALMFSPTGAGFVNGPTADEISLAQGYAEAAQEAADRVDLGALDQAVFDAEAAKTASETAQTGAESAQTAAEDAKDLADAAAASASASQVAAAASATSAQSSSRTCADWPTLLTLTGSVDSEGAEVLDSDTGTHLQATATGYDGPSVDNAGRYDWNGSWSRWVRIGDTGLAGKADKDITDIGIIPWCTTSVTGYVVTVTPTSGTLPTAKTGVKVQFKWPLASDGVNNIYVKYNGVNYQVRRPNNANIAMPVGYIRNGYPAIVRLVPGGTNICILETDVSVLDALWDNIAHVTNVTSSDGITYDITLPNNGLGEKTLFWMESGTESTGNVQFRINGGTAYPVRGFNNGFIGAGDLKPNQPNLFAWRGNPPGNFVLIGTPYSVFKTLSDSVDAIDTRVTTTEATPSLLQQTDRDNLRSAVFSNPWGDISFTNGVMTLTETDLVVSVSGMSIFAGATSGEADDITASTEGGTVTALDTAPGGHFCTELAAALAPIARVNIVRDDLAVNGSTLTDSAGQINGSAYPTPAIVLIGFVANDGDTARFHCGQGFNGARNGLINAIEAARAKGAYPIVYTGICAHPTRADRSALTNIPFENTPNYPFSFLKTTADYVFDAGAQTITSDEFATPAGDALKVGETLKVGAGDNAGSHEITAISGDRRSMTVDGTIVTSETLNVQISHISMDEETYLVPPPSERVVSKDWLGTGQAFSLDVTYEAISNMVVETCSLYGVLCIDVNTIAKEHVAANGGDPVWNAAYGTILSNLKHPRRDFQEVSYREGNRRAVRNLVAALTSSVT